METVDAPTKKVPSQHIEKHMNDLQTQVNKLKLILKVQNIRWSF